MRLILSILLALGIMRSSYAGDPPAQTIAAGATIKVNGATYRLWGIDAPEMDQNCPDGWPAGRLAALTLETIIGDQSVACEGKATDRNGRTVAICRVNDEDLGALMVKAGMAWALLNSSDYAHHEARARAAEIGLYGHDCVPAWDRRAGRR